MTRSLRRVLVGVVFITASGCGGATTSPFGKTDGSADASSGGSSGSGGAVTTGGMSGGGGTAAGSGGAPASGGAVGSGGAQASGGAVGSGGAPASGGRGGTPGTGGRGGTSGAGAASMSGGGRGGDGGGGRAGVPPACENLNESACRATPGCRADTCPGCNGATSFLRCSSMVGTPVLCPAISCPVACDQVATLADCDARTDCHSVFHDPQTCGCASIGCCAKFLRCAAGDRAVCTSPLQICDALQPHCEGPYVVGYTTFCYEGCVRSAECAL